MAIGHVVYWVAGVAGFVECHMQSILRDVRLRPARCGSSVEGGAEPCKPAAPICAGSGCRSAQFWIVTVISRAEIGAIEGNRNVGELAATFRPETVLADIKVEGAVRAPGRRRPPLTPTCESRASAWIWMSSVSGAIKLSEDAKPLGVPYVEAAPSASDLVCRDAPGVAEQTIPPTEASPAPDHAIEQVQGENSLQSAAAGQGLDELGFGVPGKQDPGVL
jgi:hypothetical protein